MLTHLAGYSLIPYRAAQLSGNTLMSRPNVLIIAYACNPLRSSEPAIGWNFIKHLAEDYNLTVLTREKNKVDIEHFLQSSHDNSLVSVQWKYYDLPSWVLLIKRKLLLGTQLYFKFWQYFAYKKFHKEFRKKNFDIVNHLNFGVIWMASPFCKLSTNFVWGPIGGGDIIPGKIMCKESISSRLRERLYKLLVWYEINVSGKNKYCRQNCAALVFRTYSSLKNNFPNENSIPKYVVSETGFNPSITEQFKLSYNQINALAVGRLEYWKGIVYAVKGFKEFIDSGGKGRLVVLGNGKEFGRINSYIRKYRLEEHVELKGQVGYNEYQSFLKSCNVLIYPSFRDGGSFTVLESMARGIPIICTNLSGPAEMVGSEAGIIVTATEPVKLTKSISDSLHYLLKNPNAGISRGILLKERALELYTWNKRVEDLKDIYCKVMMEAE